MDFKVLTGSSRDDLAAMEANMKAIGERSGEIQTQALQLSKYGVGFAIVSPPVGIGALLHAKNLLAEYDRLEELRDDQLRAINQLKRQQADPELWTVGRGAIRVRMPPVWAKDP